MVPRSHIEQCGWGRVFELPAMRQLGTRRLDPSHTRKFIVASVRTLIAALSMMVARPGTAQDSILNAPSTAALTANQFRGVDRCRDCHRAATPERIKAGVTDFISLNESEVWVSDIHSKSFELIDPAKSDLGKQICNKLGIKDIHESRACLSCHSDWRPESERPPTYERGVACESCHGPSRKWDADHSEAIWRAKPVAEKEALGMVDVRNPIKRAEQCFGCHIGNAAEGKIITHEMYAAGHPPLPGIEIESFAAQMPRHWRYLDEKVADAKSNHAGNEADAPPFLHFDRFVHKNHRYLKLGGENANEQILAHHHRAAAVVLGGVVALRESIELMRDLAVDEEPRKHTWPELASFECRACHHELATPSRRQEQRTGSIPGRPMFANWPTALIRLSIRRVSENRTSYDNKLAEFHTKLTAVKAELQRSPFGSRPRIHDTCSQLSDWLTTEVVEPVSAKPFDDRAVADAINVLIVIGSTEQHDYDSARQIAWALRVLACDALKDDTRGRTILEFLETLAPQLRLDLPNSPAHSCHPVFTIDEPRQLTPLAADPPTTLEAPILYDPERFRAQMQTLRESLR